MSKSPQTLPPAACAACPVRAANLSRLGVDTAAADFVIALAGNPNTGKSTVFNALTGLRQHTGNWPGKTVTRAEGSFSFSEKRYKLVDLPGTYSLLSASRDEEIARDFILFGQPDVTVIVVDATRLERNLNLTLQILEVTDRAVVCLNLMDEAKRRGLHIDVRQLARELGVPVVATSARFGEGLQDLLSAVEEVATGQTRCRPHRIQLESGTLKRAVSKVVARLQAGFNDLPSSRWVALRLLDGDRQISHSIETGDLAELARELVSPQELEQSITQPEPRQIRQLFEEVEVLRWKIGARTFHETLLESIYADASRISKATVSRRSEHSRLAWERRLDQLITSRIWGFPIMLALLTVVFWITISGANWPSAQLAALLIDTTHPLLKNGSQFLGVPWWLDGLIIDGMYLATAWVVSVMLPPMAIFFPLFTLLEDLGYLPRVAFNLDHLFKRAGAHGKQALTMAMGFGCNAAGVVASRIIESPRERLIAILTNNFALCNGRWPTQILISSLFIGSLAPAYLAGLVSAMAVVGIAVLGIILSFLVSWLLSRTLLKGEVSSFTLELPPYRPPRILQTLYTSLIDRTIYVLWRAVVFALPAGAAIWLCANIRLGDSSLAEVLIELMNPLGLALGLNGVILLAYVVAIPANEIVIPTILMLTVLAAGMQELGAGAGVLFELDSEIALISIFNAGGWTLLTAVNLMLFSLIHNPCSTTLYTIYRETGSGRWTAVSALLPVLMGFAVTFSVAQLWRWAGQLP